VSVQCRDARLELRDAGTTIQIRSGGITGLTFARVSETTIAGSDLIGEVVVTRSTYRCGGNLDRPGMRCIGAPLTYKGTDFDLAIRTTATPLKNGMHSAHFRATINGHDFDQEMACEFVNHAF
jgi:hypothetical protein